MLKAKVVRAVARDRIIVLIEPHGSVVELVLEEPLTQTDFDHALSIITPFKPANAMIAPGDYKAGLFYRSRLEALEFPPPPPRRKVDYAKRKRN